MKNKNMVPIIVSIAVLLVFVVGYVIFSSYNKDKYYCVDYETGTRYTFKTEDEMNKVCNKFNGVEDDQILESDEIYNDLISNNDSSYSFHPYVDSDKKIAIIVTILDCNNPSDAKEKAIKWFSNHSYNIKDYNVDFEYPCEDYDGD